jgi:ferredoxin
MSYVPIVDVDECLAHGDCVEVAPEVFRLDDVAEVIGTGPLELLVAAAESCPAQAITILDEETGAVRYP